MTDDERTQRLGQPWTDADLWQMGQQATDPGDFDFDTLPKAGETFDAWAKRTGRNLEHKA